MPQKNRAAPSNRSNSAGGIPKIIRRQSITCRDSRAKSRLWTFSKSGTYSAVPAPILLTTTLPILAKNSQITGALPKPTHDAAWWEAKTKGFDFSYEDRIDSQKFNRIIWEGMMGDKPYPATRSGADLRRGATPQPETRQVDTNARPSNQ
jgi:hypothetical protein